MSTLTAEQIKKRIAALDDYEMSQHHIVRDGGDEGDLTDREFHRIMMARSKLQKMLKDLQP